MSAVACSACYGYGYGVDGNPCPSGCRSAPELSPAIAPPVAAGRVNTGNLTMWLKALYHAADGHQFNERLGTALYHINLYAEQSKEEGKQEALDLTVSVGQLRERAEKAEEGLAQMQYERDNLQKLAISRREWAEKAEAERDTLKESLRLVNVDHGLWMARTHAAEDARDDSAARVKELEASIATDDGVLRSSVPERWKNCASPVGAVQSYIAELEQLDPSNHYDLKA